LRCAAPVILALVTCTTPAARAQPGPDGYDFVTIGAVGNRAYDGPDPFNLVAGRGAVDYQYRIARTELTTAQAVEFFNAVYARPDPLPFVGQFWWGTPVLWGATVDSSYTGPGVRYRLRTDIANAGMVPVGGFSWRMGAVLCNWLHNGKAGAQSAFLDGAYDVGTFGPEITQFEFTDQPAHHPGARYWLPTLDEWMKAVHYDPLANGGAGRWWTQPNGTDTPLTYGPPPSFGGDGTGMANAGFRLSGNTQYQIPLGSYADVLTPWGLLDAAGGTKEWLETIRTLDGMWTRGADGSYWAVEGAGADVSYSWGQLRPHIRSTYTGIRLAAIVPGPTSALVFLIGGGVFLSRRRRSFRHATSRDHALGDR
jgi:hypothetical protein